VIFTGGRAASVMACEWSYMHDKVKPSPLMGEGCVGVTPLKTRGSQHASSVAFCGVTDPETKMKHVLIL
jgi:hypothetical protein